VGPLLQKLDDKDHDVQMAAVEALGKLRALAASSALVKLYQVAKTDDKLKYLTALGSIGDPATEKILSDALDDESLDASMKQQAALGLGRIASPTSVRRLWSLLPNPDMDLRDSTISALQLAGDASLDVPNTPPDLALRVAASVKSRKGDLVIGQAMRSRDRALRIAAMRAAVKRPGVVADLVDVLRTLSREADGDLIDADVAALVSTPEGRQACASFETDPVVAAFLKRREALTHQQG
jgi:HEAT repeat protein